MQTKEYRTVDKTAWQPGAWQGEPDKVQWPDEATGLPCLIVRGPSGALCGYVGVAEGHPYFGKDYESVPVEAHGGLTFASACADTSDETSHICHVPDPGEPDHVWWFGFDCAHSGDLCPKYLKQFGGPFGMSEWESYKDLDYVKREVTNLAAQLAVVK